MPAKTGSPPRNAAGCHCAGRTPKRYSSSYRLLRIGPPDREQARAVGYLDEALRFRHDRRPGNHGDPGKPRPRGARNRIGTDRRQVEPAVLTALWGFHQHADTGGMGDPARFAHGSDAIQHGVSALSSLNRQHAMTGYDHSLSHIERTHGSQQGEAMADIVLQCGTRPEPSERT